jgi:hypothetical protein
MTQQQIISKVRERLSAPELRKFDLTVFEQGVRKEDGWLYVPITCGASEVSPFEYAPMLNAIEESFEAQGVKLLLVPAEAPL